MILNLRTVLARDHVCTAMKIYHMAFVKNDPSPDENILKPLLFRPIALISGHNQIDTHVKLILGVSIQINNDLARSFSRTLALGFCSSNHIAIHINLSCDNSLQTSPLTNGP